MPLPQLNTQGLDITNTLMKIQQMNDSKEANIQRNALFNLQKRKLDYELSPEVLELQRSAKLAQEASDNALAQQRAVEAQMKAADQIATAMKNVPFTKDLKHYAAFRKQMSEHPVYGKAAAVLPDEKDWLKPDMQSETGFSIPEEDAERFKKIYTNLTETVADRAEGRKPGELVKIQVPGSDGKLRIVNVGVKLAPGEVYDPTVQFGPEARLYESNMNKGPEVRTFTEGDNEVQKQYNPETNMWEKIPGVSGGPRFKPESDNENAPVIKTFTAGDQEVQKQYNKTTKQWEDIPGAAGGPRFKPETEMEKAVGQMVQKTFEGNAASTGETKSSVGSGIIDYVKEAGNAVKEKFSKKPDGEAGTVSKEITEQPAAKVKPIKQITDPKQIDAILREAEAAIAKGADPDKILEELKKLGIDVKRGN